MQHIRDDGDQRSDANVIATRYDGPGQARVILRGRFDAVAIARLAVALEEVVADRIRFVTINAAALTASEPGLLSLLGRTQRRLETGGGLLTLTGLAQRVLPNTETSADGDWELAR